MKIHRYLFFAALLAVPACHGPTPPTPTQPTPVVDALAAPLATAYVQDGSPAGPTLTWAGVFRTAADVTAKDTTLNTVGDLFAKIKASDPVPATSLTSIRGVVGAELGRQLGSDPTKALDATTRQLAAAQFARMSLLLQGVTK